MALPKDLLKNKFATLPPAALPNQYKAKDGTRPLMKKRKDYTPVTWDKYFQGEVDVTVDDNVFRVYTAGDKGPVLLLLHGGGHSGLSWAVFTAAMMELCDCRILAMDIRGHGHTKTTEDRNLAADVLAKDVGDVISAYFKDDPPPIVMLGHSMGGAIAVHVAVDQVLKTLVGIVVIDVVEGTALESLSAMDGFLKSRPKAFKSIEEAIEWSIRSNQVRNLDSAKVSIPGQLYRGDLVSNEICCHRCPTDQIEHLLHSESNEGRSSPISSVPESISEEELGDEIVIKEQERQKQPSASATEKHAPGDINNDKYTYTWRVDLTKTEIFWHGWFKDMSKLFLSSSVPKLLILAGIDRLDKDLTIGQMQGKFQMHVLPNCGHTVHEDAPEKVAELMMTFLHRHKLATPKGLFQRSFFPKSTFAVVEGDCPRHMPSC